MITNRDATALPGGHKRSRPTVVPLLEVVSWSTPQHLPQGRCQAGDRHLKFNEIRDNLDTRSTPEQVAGLVREHWGIESLHWLRDTVYREDDFTARTGSGPRVMAALRNLEVGAIHLIGRRDITETTRWATRLMDRSFKILAR